MMASARRVSIQWFLSKNRRVIWVQGPWVGNFKSILCSNGSISCLEIISKKQILVWFECPINEETGELAISKKKSGPGPMGLDLLELHFMPKTYVRTYVRTPPHPLQTAICVLDSVLDIFRYPPSPYPYPLGLAPTHEHINNFCID